MIEILFIVYIILSVFHWYGVEIRLSKIAERIEQFKEVLHNNKV